MAEKPSAAYWLLPVFLSWIGGIIAWAVTKDKDPKMAKNMLILGLVLTVVYVIIGFSLALLTVVY